MHMVWTLPVWALVIITFALSLAGCAAPTDSQTNRPAAQNSLRVGVSPDYPPLVFSVGEQIAGVEADLANALGQALGRPVQFVPLRWEDQVSALLSQQIDIIMSGMTVTDARRVRVAFTEPYFETGLSVLMRIEDAGRYGSLQELADPALQIGVIKASTADVYVQRAFPEARIAVPDTSAAVFQLKTRRIDVIVHDRPAVVWLASENEGELMASALIFERQDLAWAVRPSDVKLLASLNQILGKWKADGTLNGILERWLRGETIRAGWIGGG